MTDFDIICRELSDLITIWERIFLSLPLDLIKEKRNSQDRNIKQILGHMVDSATNNTHRIVHLQYQESPLIFPDYANHGINDRWIAIQNYQEEDWNDLVELWKNSNLHIIHVIRNIDQSKLGNVWISALDEKISLESMVKNYPRHFRLHLDEITDLMDDA